MNEHGLCKGMSANCVYGWTGIVQESNKQPPPLKSWAPELNGRWMTNKPPPTEIADSMMANPWTSWFLDPEGTSQSMDEVAVARLAVGKVEVERDPSCVDDETIHWEFEKADENLEQDLRGQQEVGENIPPHPNVKSGLAQDVQMASEDDVSKSVDNDPCTSANFVMGDANPKPPHVSAR